ncbi:hypothetical protein AOX59_17655 [Lentibacillus amyloliquefaciens]|uniref:Uncharacterized protein n=1 Tax=Lentibacillus amyloliquefaciens TaxID=1472767 RepID=A0A0U4FBN1_9BACI|nr:hypothetical protein AOX59_17655 [Lentibacillus amyloliquefaciens]
MFPVNDKEIINEAVIFKQSLCPDTITAGGGNIICIDFRNQPLQAFDKQFFAVTRPNPPPMMI